MKVLVVVDMQNDFINGSLANPKAEKIVQPIMNYVKDFSGLIVATLDTHDENYLTTQEGRNLPIKHCVENTLGWCITEDLDLTLGSRAMRINKPTFGYAQEIAREINDRINAEILYHNKIERIDSIEFVGTVTEICVVSNVLGLKPYFPEAEFIVHADMCAGLSEEGHKAALAVMKACQVTVVGE